MKNQVKVKNCQHAFDKSKINATALIVFIDVINCDEVIYHQSLTETLKNYNDTKW